MVLTIHGHTVSSTPVNLKEFLKCHSSVLEKANNFRSEVVTSVDALFSLYVGQGEYAVIPSYDKAIKIVGSDDATTCHIIVMMNCFGSVSVSHFDGSDNEDQIIENIVDELTTLDEDINELNAYVVGGYESGDDDTEKNSSEQISVKLLQNFINASCTINLALWCTVKSNTKTVNGKSFPLFNGLAVDRETLKVFPAMFPVKVPNYVLRHASHWARCTNSTTNIYDYKSKSVTVCPFRNSRRENFRFYLDFPDSLLLRYFSTSPSVEPPSFCSSLRSVFTLLGYYSSEQLFPGNLPRMFIIDSSGEWIEQKTYS